jgi:hypothetical protein
MLCMIANRPLPVCDERLRRRREAFEMKMLVLRSTLTRLTTCFA